MDFPSMADLRLALDLALPPETSEAHCPFCGQSVPGPFWPAVSTPVPTQIGTTPAAGSNLGAAVVPAGTAVVSPALVAPPSWDAGTSTGAGPLTTAPAVNHEEVWDVGMRSEDASLPAKRSRTSSAPSAPVAPVATSSPAPVAPGGRPRAKRSRGGRPGKRRALSENRERQAMKACFGCGSLAGPSVPGLPQIPAGHKRAEGVRWDC
ncbi:hypothetical protein Vretifemale_5490 [Volvox reticuliferus]|uniref:Uncharacterized protein n=1 Tax=Volvox reticuliferus TaxID=1737510 RepID=A0A8J4C6Q2_9CHLO|nr:hypothetical protein Vretifemale_5490 [Volvox reticuliferus]